jgi:hypothetical protein
MNLILETNKDYIEPEKEIPKRKRSNISSFLFEQVLDRYEEEMNNSTFVSPLIFWLDILNDTELDLETRDKAAVQSSKFLHKQQPRETEIKQEISAPNFQISFVGDE